MTHWVERAEQQLVEELENGDISEKEFREQMRDVLAEHEQEAQDEADQAYNEVMSGW